MKSPVVVVDNPNSILATALHFFEHLAIKNYSTRTIKKWSQSISLFNNWCTERDINRPDEVTRELLERYQNYLYRYRKKDNKPLTYNTQHQRIASLKTYFKYLAKKRYIPYNPAGEIELPKKPRRLPKAILNQQEAETIINQPNTKEPLGIRDRAILETFYSTGIRRMELVNLQLYDIDLDRGTIFIRLGKGQKDRLIPIGQRALKWIEKYLSEVRPQLAVPPDNERQLFLTNQGQPFTENRLGTIVSRYIKQANIAKQGSCHLFRHTMATLMLENGADIRYIQQMLGHARLDTTQIYTQVSIKKLKEIHERTHPAKLEPTKTSDDAV